MTESDWQIMRFSPRSVSLLQIHGNHGERARLLAAKLGAACAESGSTASARAFSIGPTEWLLVDFSLDEVRRRLSTGFGRMLMRITDVSAAFAALRIDGTAARTILASDIGSPRAVDFGSSGHYVRTRLGQIDVVLQCRGPEAFEVYVDRSLAEYFEAWLRAQYHARFSASERTTP